MLFLNYGSSCVNFLLSLSSIRNGNCRWFFQNECCSKILKFLNWLRPVYDIHLYALFGIFSNSNESIPRLLLKLTINEIDHDWLSDRFCMDCCFSVSVWWFCSDWVFFVNWTKSKATDDKEWKINVYDGEWNCILTNHIRGTVAANAVAVAAVVVLAEWYRRALDCVHCRDRTRA